MPFGNGLCRWNESTYLARPILALLEDTHEAFMQPTDVGTAANPTLGDAILDRLVHNAHRLQLAGESMRKQNARANALDGVSNA